MKDFDAVCELLTDALEAADDPQPLLDLQAALGAWEEKYPGSARAARRVPAVDKLLNAIHNAYI